MLLFAASITALIAALLSVAASCIALATAIEANPIAAHSFVAQPKASGLQLPDFAHHPPIFPRPVWRYSTQPVITPPKTVIVSQVYLRLSCSRKFTVSGPSANKVNELYLHVRQPTQSSDLSYKNSVIAAEIPTMIRLLYHKHGKFMALALQVNEKDSPLNGQFVCFSRKGRVILMANFEPQLCGMRELRQGDSNSQFQLLDTSWRLGFHGYGRRRGQPYRGYQYLRYIRQQKHAKLQCYKFQMLTPKLSSPSPTATTTATPRLQTPGLPPPTAQPLSKDRTLHRRRHEKLAQILGRVPCRVHISCQDCTPFLRNSSQSDRSRASDQLWAYCERCLLRYCRERHVDRRQFVPNVRQRVAEFKLTSPRPNRIPANNTLGPNRIARPIDISLLKPK